MPDFPDYFKRIYDTSGIPEFQVQGKFHILTPQFTNLVIYGRKITSPYPDDAAISRRLNEEGRYLSECFSVACPEGESGFVELAVVTPITEDEFLQAQNRQWVDP